MKLLSVLQIIEKTLKQNSDLNEKQIENLLNLLSKYKARELIYPRVIMRVLKVETITVYKLLMMLEKENLVEKNYEFYCHQCSVFCGDIYETIGDIPDEMYCETCGDRLTFENNAVVVYRVLKDVRD